MRERLCEYVLYHNSRWIDPEPEETCDMPCHPDFEHCAQHGGQDYDPDEIPEEDS